MRDLYESGDDNVPKYWSLGVSADSECLPTGQSDGDVKVGFSKVF